MFLILVVVVLYDFVLVHVNIRVFGVVSFSSVTTAAAELMQSYCQCAS